jgi:hypothetical protein
MQNDRLVDGELTLDNIAVTYTPIRRLREKTLLMDNVKLRPINYSKSFHGEGPGWENLTNVGFRYDELMLFCFLCDYGIEEAPAFESVIYLAGVIWSRLLQILSKDTPGNPQMELFKEIIERHREANLSSLNRDDLLKMIQAIRTPITVFTPPFFRRVSRMYNDEHI